MNGINQNQQIRKCNGCTIVSKTLFLSLFLLSLFFSLSLLFQSLFLLTLSHFCLFRSASSLYISLSPTVSLLQARPPRHAAELMPRPIWSMWPGGWGGLTVQVETHPTDTATHAWIRIDDGTVDAPLAVSSGGHDGGVHQPH